MNDSIDKNLAMTPQQRQFAAGKTHPLAAYKEVMVGDGSWSRFFAFELYRLFFAGTESFIGIALRLITLPLFFKSCGKGLVVGHGCTIRQAQRIEIGKKVIIDDYCLVDVRTKADQNTESFVKIGDYSYIGRFSIVSAKYGKITLGKACNIGSNSRIATQGEIEIGDSTLISSFVYIGGGNHGSDDLEKPIMEQEMELKGGVKIGANCWIGTKATIVDGVKIGNNAIIGAHSLVREDVPDNAVVAGTPAKIIKYRDGKN
ncbi:MAG: acyltransferase [Proteobacteria bacterium]|nr:acyltransferase [Pseudomonadota bacterium]